MLNAFVLKDHLLQRVAVETYAALQNLDPVWIDLLNPTLDKIGWVETALALGLPRRPRHHGALRHRPIPHLHKWKGWF